MVMPFMRVVVQTGRMLGRSAARLAVIAAAHLAQRDATPEVTGELVEFLRQGHRLIEVG